MEGKGDGALSIRQRTLGEIAAAADLTAADVVALSGISRSTIWRLWSDAGWLGKISGANANLLAAVVPGVRPYAARAADSVAVQRSAEVCEQAGLEVDWVRVGEMVDNGAAARDLVPAMTAAVAMAGGTRDAAQALARCWGKSADGVCDAIFRPADDGGVFVDPTAVLQGAERIVDGPANDEPRAVIGRGMALHRLTRNCGYEHAPTEQRNGFPLSSAFKHRGAVTGGC
ncbi:putative protein OS=Tsukamurella paurometabola (strain ATCC 8368 / DSM / CCUG 35730 /CIP 100753 / JCM 10117 / KCTC 9821 / NBRC 16120 / NCIMB 702349/ NCTC 13040) OX=521096 GN=Tpau_0577 PE=4 SV=1 [Tsukamurella paurometabola]|uniref:Uncharacterized protein n=1 Tax=Tsukamurella paurometabola (strain ATCC 8368 / DSM 20162 / CCUG 35730 / CIP 100753 / JCM 10117 / KCTC 9821 / NBRC 16120 / NCIMB 702349 / NCTC 13040) TaxID=521096 RepID=D5USF0_TSUPD|nr:hypothetical protein [Tsukamurella paurometabola]ADG77217.1 hypothetical protein Tpau_0577 [Tsukamurella paurometabola DSM 20162]SUP43184.1 Uncharacterised protein [Tsukamurella paurometabola]